MKAYFENEENLTRLQSAAQSWLHTPFMPNAGIKGSGVSCQMLLGQLYIESQLLPPDFKIPEGPMDWSVAQKTSLIAAFMDQQPQFAVVPAPAQPGDMIGFKLGGCVHHCGVMLRANGQFLHCLRNRGVIISNLRDATYLGRVQNLWRPQTVSGLNGGDKNL